MQTVNNNFTVEALVAKYRNFVKENCPKEDSFYAPKTGDTLEFYHLTSKDEAEEQLLVTLYKRVAGNDADPNILGPLSKYAEDFYVEAFNEDELTFLSNHFSEVSACIFSYFVAEYYGRVFWLQRPSQKVYDIIATIKVEAGMTVFIGSLGLCDIAMLFPNCTIKGYCEDSFADKEMWALGQIRLFAAGIKSEVLPCYKDTANSQYMADVDVAIIGAADLPYSNSKTEVLFSYMKPNSNLLLFVGKRNLAEDSFLNLRKLLVEGKYIDSIVSFEEADDVLDNISPKNIFIHANKAVSNSVYIKNDVTGEEIQLTSNMLNSKILWPSYYLTARPQNGISLSEIASFQDLSIKKNSDVSFKSEYNYEEDRREWVLSDKEKMIKVVVPTNLATEYKNANINDGKLSVAGDYTFTGALGKVHNIEWPCVLLYGRKGKYTVGYVKNLPPEGIIAFHRLVCLVPKEGIDLRYLAALLLTPEVKNQIISICEEEVDAQVFPLIMDKIIVPNHFDLERATFLSEANYNAFESSRKELEQEHKRYIKAVRMRKHALTQSASAIEATFYALNAYRERQNGTISDNERISRIKQTTVKDAFEYLSKATKDLLVKLDHIADVEYTFAKPEWINPEEFIENYIQKHKNGWVNFKPVVSWTKGHNLADKDIKNPSGEIILHKGEPIHLMMFPKDALKQILDNIVSNAKSHGFKDESRNDYQLRFSWENDGFALKICVENNGTPIPSDRSASSLLEYGVSTSLDSNGHHGIGCNEIDVIMRKYEGKVELVSSPEDKFKVKYVLTFNRINTLKTL